MDFGWIKKRKIVTSFSGGYITYDSCVLPLKNVDKKIKLTEKISKILNDPRNKSKCTHSILSMLRQLFYGIAQGFEALNNHEQLRKDKLIQAAVGSDKTLARPPSLCRFENWITRKTLVQISKILVENFIESYSKAPRELILDFDGTNDQVYSKQVGGFSHVYYHHKCFLPLYVFCGNNLLVEYLRPGNVPDRKHSWAILKLLVKKLRLA